MASLREAFFKTEKLPMKTLQKQIHQRPPKASKFMRSAGKSYKSASTRVPMDIKPRWKEKMRDLHHK